MRLSQGSAERETVYAEDPAEVAEAFAQAGARWIHLVDLDRAFDQYFDRKYGPVRLPRNDCS